MSLFVVLRFLLDGLNTRLVLTTVFAVSSGLTNSLEIKLAGVVGFGLGVSATVSVVRLANGVLNIYLFPEKYIHIHKMTQGIRQIDR